MMLLLTIQIVPVVLHGLQGTVLVEYKAYLLMSACMVRRPDCAALAKGVFGCVCMYCLHVSMDI